MKSGGPMWIHTHYYIAKQIHNYVKEKYQLELQLGMLQYGSVLPDLNWNMKNVSHYYDEGYSYWLEEVGQLLKNKKYREIKEFSQKLGIVLHFTADFFTFAHNDEKLKTNMLKHFNYEIKFHHDFIHSSPDITNQKNYYGNAYSLMKQLRQKYLYLQPNIEKDIYFIYTASFLLTDLMVEAILLPAIKAA
jgi:hypothetical protein